VLRHSRVRYDPHHNGICALRGTRDGASSRSAPTPEYARGGAQHQLDDVPGIAIEQAELFRALAPEQLARVRPLLRERRVERQRALFFEGEAAESLWVLGRGQVRLYKASASGRVTTLETLGPGRIFGAISALEKEVYPASAEGVTGGVAWCLPRSVLLKLLAEDPRVGMEVLRIVSRHLHEAHERLRSFAHDAAPARLARALLDASSDGEAHVTRRALAEAAGTTVETAIRVLRRFEREGVLQGGAGLLRVLDSAALRRIAGV
jgi:CRP-like cAMP-binding protein